MYNTCKLLHSSRAGLYSVCLYNVSFYAGVTAGLLTMPDSPQMLFYTFSLWMIARISIDERNWYTWILLGLSTGLCIMSKVHGVFIWIGLGLFILFCKRTWLTMPQLYVALLLSILLTSPIIIWNLQNDFATYRFNSERVTINNETVNFRSFLSEVTSHVFFNNPFNFLLIALGLSAYAKGTINRVETFTIFQFIALPLAVLLLILSLFRSTILPHWSGPAYVCIDTPCCHLPGRT
jgi:4-amino-4-deoxy-L-arabinose transferase-like glycosyltransferase